MPPPAADAPCPEQAFNATALKWHTCAWLLLPVLVFLAGWMHWYAALPLTLLTAAGLAPRKRKEPQTRDSLPAFPLFTRSSFLALAAFAALTALSGWGEWVNQHPDHIVRNACLRELVASPWPVIFPDGNVLIYNTGFWLVPALAGKLAGLDAARVLVVLWGAWGLFLSWLWLCVFSGRRSLLLALLMAAFGSLLNLQCWLGLNLFRLHYFGTAEQIMCSANASIPVLLFFIFLASGRMPLYWMPILFAATAFYSPLAALGGLPLAACQWRRQWKGVLPLRDVLLHPSFSAAVLLGTCFLLYYGAVNAPSSHMGMRPFYTHPGDFLLMATSFLLYALFCWRDFRKNPLFICTLATGLILPFFYVNGDVNDLLCKGSVPAMACLLTFLVSAFGYGFCWLSEWRPGSTFPIIAVLPAPSRRFWRPRLRKQSLLPSPAGSGNSFSMRPRRAVRMNGAALCTTPDTGGIPTIPARHAHGCASFTVFRRVIPHDAG